MEKVYLTLPTTGRGVYFTPELCKTGQITLRAVLGGGFATVTTVLSFRFYLFRLNL
jgi:hypothetical protein